MKMIDQALRYFHAFESKDLVQLTELLHPDVTLRDWNVDIAGRDEVLAEMKRAFQFFMKIEVSPIKIYHKNKAIIVELDIVLDDDRIKVVDILEYSETQKICAIRAFKG